MKTLLQLASAVATEIQIPLPAAVYGLTDPTPRRMVRYANKAVDLVNRSLDWNVMRKERVFTAIAGTEQTGIIPTDFSRMIPQTFWNRTDARPLQGPLPPHQWQRLASNNTGIPVDSFTIRGSDIHVLPALDGGESLAFEYISNEVVESSLGVGKTTFSHDTDVNRLDDELVILAMIADWLAAEAQPFDMPLALFRGRLNQLAAQDNPTDGILHTDVPAVDYRYDINTGQYLP